MRNYIPASTLLLALCSFAAFAQVPPTPAAVPATPPPIQLFNGKDMTGFVLFAPAEGEPSPCPWQVKDGCIECTGVPTGYFRTEKAYSDYKLTFEWRWTGTPGNSGCLVHIQPEDVVWPKSIEAQLHTENAGDIWVVNGTDFAEHVKKDDPRVPKKAPHNEKPVGEWNTMEVVCSGDTITVTVNGLEQNKATMTSVKEGFIGFQSEGAPIAFRNLSLTPLKDAGKAPNGRRRPQMKGKG